MADDPNKESPDATDATDQPPVNSDAEKSARIAEAKARVEAAKQAAADTPTPAQPEELYVPAARIVKFDGHLRRSRIALRCFGVIIDNVANACYKVLRHSLYIFRLSTSLQ